MANTKAADTGAYPVTSGASLCASLFVPTPENLAAAALSTGTARSAEYRAGLLDALKFKMHGEPIHCPHRAGSVQFDAYFAGNRHGFDVFRAHLEMQGGRHD